MMRCVGKFIDDRTCDICKHINIDGYETCKELKSLRISTDKQAKCPHSEYKWSRGADEYGRDEDYQFLYCHKKGDNCSPEVNCLNCIFDLQDYVEGTEMYGETPKRVRGWVSEMPRRDENGKLVIHIKCDDQYKGARGNCIREELGEIKKIKEEI